MVHFLIVSTISDVMINKLASHNKTNKANKMWSELCLIHEDKSESVQMDYLAKLDTMQAEEDSDIEEHLN